MRRAFEAIDQAAWTEQELITYEHLIKIYLDNLAVEAYKIEVAEARGEASGKAIGRTEEKIEIANKMLLQNYSFFDESRFGTHSNIGHGWLKKGQRSGVEVKLGFQNFYVYSAVSPNTGTDYTILLPYVNTNSMNLFLQHMSEGLGDKQALLVLDCAG